MVKKPTLSNIETVITKVFPDAKVLTFQKSSLGNINWVYTIDIEHPIKRLILKIVYRQDREEQEILKKEAKIIKTINSKNIAGVPQLIDFDHSKKNVPWVYLLESYLDGVPLIMQHVRISENKLKPIIKKVAQFIAGVQKIKYKKIKEFEKFRPDYHSFYKYVADYSPKYYKICCSYNRISKKLLKNSLDFVLRESKVIKDKKFVLNHGDISSHNILIKHYKFVGIIDFEAVQTMTPEFDLVTFYHEFLWRYPKLWQLLLSEYTVQNKIPADFKERLNIVMGYRSLRYLYIAVKNRIYQYMEGDIQRMKEVLDGSFLKTIKF